MYLLAQEGEATPVAPFAGSVSVGADGGSRQSTITVPELPLRATSLTRMLVMVRGTLPVAPAATVKEMFATVPDPETGDPEAMATRNTPPERLDEIEDPGVKDPAVTEGDVSRAVSYAIRNSRASIPDTASMLTGTLTCWPQ